MVVSSRIRALRPALIAAAATALVAAALTLVPAANAATLTVAAKAATGDGSTTDPNITYVGRWDTTSTAFIASNWAGSYLRVGFTGTTVKVTERNLLDLYASVDGGPYLTFANVKGTVDLTPAKLKAGRHTLVVAYRQVAGHFTGDEGFGGLVLDAGATTFPVPRRPQLVEFIGDSITAGTATSQLALTDYAWLASEQIGVEHTQIAGGGMCLTETADGCFGHEVRYFLQSGVAGTAAWDFTRYRADVVVINLGTNDVGHGVSSVTFQAKYTTFLKDVRVRYPNAAILALKTFRSRYVAQTEAAVQAVNAAGDTNAFFIDTDGWLPADGSGLADSVHPNDQGHQAITAKLAPILAAHLPSVTVSGAVKVVNRNSGKVLSVAGVSAVDGAAVVQSTDTGAASQRWRVVDAGAGYSKLVNVGSGEILDVKARSTAEGAAVIQWRDNGGTNQQWRIGAAGTGYRTFASRVSGRSLAISGASVTDGAPVVQSTSTDVTSQQWMLTSA